MTLRRTIAATDNRAVLGAAVHRNNGRYNGNGREWATPPEVFDPLNAQFRFTLDPCATALNAKCAKFYTEADDGLSRSWAGERVFMNPPYGREIYAWTRKAREESKHALIVGLLPASCDLAWWHEDIVGLADITFIRGRVRFLTDGPYRASGFFASVIVVWRGHSGHGLAHVLGEQTPLTSSKFASEAQPVTQRGLADLGAKSTTSVGGSPFP